ncbi:hypothetical protein KSC_097450 [Ktedonobacter sp. SOSP1-52]|uniref:hypothetical protein n=1 Tax=Ktedonobacter sp. SOSP1-52 TaxID=2778366 RepID=UPI001915BB1C|nr:hypothetical protein [Ktedonobacter sp. SOSP1-52]GHO70853.1 hypothetical protein KSC_097450 [Ktedonobacter sp. SOSP1-52]
MDETNKTVSSFGGASKNEERFLQWKQSFEEHLKALDSFQAQQVLFREQLEQLRQKHREFADQQEDLKRAKQEMKHLQCTPLQDTPLLW